MFSVDQSKSTSQLAETLFVLRRMGSGYSLVVLNMRPTAPQAAAMAASQSGWTVTFLSG